MFEIHVGLFPGRYKVRTLDKYENHRKIWTEFKNLEVGLDLEI